MMAGSNHRILFVPSNEIHVGWMLPIAEAFPHAEFMYFPERKENADHYLKKFHKKFHEYQRGLMGRLQPAAVVLGNDWAGPEVDCIREARALGIPSICIQEGPLNFFDPRNGPRLNNAEYVFLHGPRMRKYLNRDHGLFVTGNPKYDCLDKAPLPSKPTVMINSNFTYRVYEEIRQMWVGQVVRACQELGVDYFVSKHPRDKGEFPAAWNAVGSDAFTIHDQIKKASLFVTRFSTAIYEALFLGREVVYFNPHKEPFRIFSEDDTGGIFVEETWENLARTLEAAIQRAGKDEPGKQKFLLGHCATTHKDSTERCVEKITEICDRESRNHGSRPSPGGFSFCILTDGKNPEALQRVIQSVRIQEVPKKEIIIVGKHKQEDGVHYVPAEEELEQGYRGKMRNLGVEKSTLENIVILDDDVVLTPSWCADFQEFDQNFDIMTSRVRLPDGTRYWDHAVIGGKDGRVLLPAEELPADGSIPYLCEGTAWVMKRSIAKRVKWLDSPSFKDEVDVGFSKECHDLGISVAYNPRCVAYKIDPEFSRIGRIIMPRMGEGSHAWIRGRPELEDPEKILQLGLEKGKLRQFVEFADCLRAGCSRYPEDEKLQRAWEAFLENVKGDVEGDKWFEDGDPYCEWLIHRLDHGKENGEEADLLDGLLGGEGVPSVDKVLELVKSMPDGVDRDWLRKVDAKLEEARNHLDGDLMKFWGEVRLLVKNKRGVGDPSGLPTAHSER